MALPNHVRSPDRILLVRFSHLGDVVCALPLYHALRSAFPGARLAWATQAEFAPLIEPLPGLERVIRLDRRGGLRAVRRLRQSMRAFNPDLSVDAQGNYKSAVAALLSGAPRRVGSHPRDWREVSARHLATERAPLADGPHGCIAGLAAAWAVHTNSNLAPAAAQQDAGRLADRIGFKVLRGRGMRAGEAGAPTPVADAEPAWQASAEPR